MVSRIILMLLIELLNLSITISNLDIHFIIIKGNLREIHGYLAAS